MPKLVLKTDYSGADAAKVEGQSFTNYDGPTPPSGVFPVSVISIKIGESKTSKKQMLTVYAKVDAPKGHRFEKFNGFLFSDYLVIPESRNEEHFGLQVGNINVFFDALDETGKARKAFWGNNAVLDEKGEKIAKVGELTLKGGIPAKVNGKTSKERYTDPETKKTTVRDQARVNGWMKGVAAGDAPAVEEEPEFEEEDGTDEGFVEEESTEPETEPDFEEEPEEEPAPVKKPAAKKAPAKKAAPKPKPKPEPEPEPEDEPEDDEDPDVEPEVDETDYSEEEPEAEDEAEEEPEEEPEEAPAPKRTRKSAF